MPLILHEAAGIVSMVGELINEYLRREPMYEEICSGMLKQIIAGALRISRTAGGSSGGKEALAREVMNYIDLHYGEKIDSNTIAGLFGYHPYYLSRVMTEIFGTTIYKYLIRRRSKLSAADAPRRRYQRLPRLRLCRRVAPVGGDKAIYWFPPTKYAGVGKRKVEQISAAPLL